LAELQSAVQAAVTFSLIDAATAQPIPGYDPITNGATIALASLPTQQLSIRANPSSAVGSVTFAFDSVAGRVENIAPYALCGDQISWYVACPELNVVGAHVVSATVYSGTNATGTAASPVALSFTVQSAAAGGAGSGGGGASGSSGSGSAGASSGAGRATGGAGGASSGAAGTGGSMAAGSAPAAPPMTFSLTNADNAQPIAGYNPIANGATIDLASLPTQQLSIHANPSSAVGSITLTLDSVSGRVENIAPYALCGDQTTYDVPCADLNVAGAHRLTATAYSGTNATGTAASPVVLDFTMKKGSGGGGSGGTSGTGGASGAAGASGSGGVAGASGSGGTTGSSGSAGTAGAAGAGGTSGGPVVFPLKLSSNRRYLVDQSGVPFRMHGEAAWDASVSLSLSEWRTYLDNRKAKGFNTALVQITNPVRYHSGSTAPASKGAGGALPFLKNASGGTWDGDPGFAGNMVGQGGAYHFDADFSTPNPTYFSWIDTMVAEAGARGIAVLMTACYLGYGNGAADGWWQTLNNSANTQSVSFGFGKYLGARYKNVPNLIWEMGVDMLPPAGSEGELRAHKILEGIRAAGDTHLWTGHWVHDYLSTDEAAFANDMDIEGVYTHGPYPTLGPTYPLMRLGYGHAPAMPTVLLETTYEGEHGVSAAQLREYMWGAQLSGTAGVLTGNIPIWDFESGWSNALESIGSKDMQRIASLLNTLPWQDLVPSGLSGMKTLITAGAGTFANYTKGVGATAGDDWVVAAATPSGSALVAYVPATHVGSIKVDMTALSGSTRARWYDPTRGSFTSIGTLPNTGTHDFGTPGTNGAGAADWVLVLDR
jgi:hypothetical protein